MTITCIVAMAENRVIGRDGDLPWRLPADLKRFKRVTMGHTLVMGRKTWESIGRPLPGRTSVVLTKQVDYEVPEGVRVAASMDEALAGSAGEDEVFVIGGASVYAEALPRADRLVLTLVRTTSEGDVRFPDLEERDWEIVGEEDRPADERNPHDLCFRTYERAQPEA